MCERERGVFEFFSPKLTFAEVGLKDSKKFIQIRNALVLSQTQSERKRRKLNSSFSV